MPDCIHDMEPAWCSICLGNDDAAPALEPVGPTIAARFTGGQCPAGNDTIYEGEDIALTEAGWCHSSCLDQT